MRYLGLDLGKKTLGIAISDKTGMIASFYDSIRYEKEDDLIDIIVAICKEEKIESIILGLPKNMDGSLGFRAKETIEFKEKLEEKINIEVIFQDERLTTKVATDVLIDADLSRAKRKKVIDGVSAVVILQGYLDKKE